ncbi:MAG: membrane lipoprotein lipid attachment site-containing protein [Tannerella sp.]|jgi:hypothetical protein|nr:membrane lipoprotein lipid attachment site-containing protein [Tannerella sp.]
MKKIVILFVLTLTLSGCNKGEPVYIPVEAVFRELKPLGKGLEPSCVVESIGDTLRFRIVTRNIRTPAEFRKMKAYIEYQMLYVWVYTTPNDFPPSDMASFGTTHEISFDLLHLKPRSYSLKITINSYGDDPILINHHHK